MRRLLPRITWITLVVPFLLLLLAGCSEPPRKEIDQAQAAAELALAAGADKFAAEEYSAATAGLQKARAAVDQRDYRQALNYAIDARQRAQNALNQAPEGRKRAQKAAEAVYGEIATRANRLQAQLRTAEAGHAPAKELRAPRAALAEARKALQEASTSIGLGNYDQSSKSLTEVRGKLDAAIQDVERIPLRLPKASAPRRELPPSR